MYSHSNTFECSQKYNKTKVMPMLSKCQHITASTN
jgi:hypothetical protein